MRYLIDYQNHLIGTSGHISKDELKNDFEKYFKRFGFASSESARETAEMLGLTDAKIIVVRVR